MSKNLFEQQISFSDIKNIILKNIYDHHMKNILGRNKKVEQK